MQCYQLDHMVGGWFVGDFEPTAYRTNACEVGIKSHRAKEPWPTHYHEQVTEITVLLEGQMRLNGTVFQSGDILVIPPLQVVSPTFLTACRMVVVKLPGLCGDKVVVAQ